EAVARADGGNWDYDGIVCTAFERNPAGGKAAAVGPAADHAGGNGHAGHRSDDRDAGITGARLFGATSRRGREGWVRADQFEDEFARFGFGERGRDDAAARD